MRLSNFKIPRYDTMEFPPEIALHIRGYTKPVFVHWRIFKEVKELVDFRHWASLRKALQGPTSIQVSEVASEYLVSNHCRKFCEDALCSFDLSVGINRHLRCWCQETQTTLQVCRETKKMVPVPVLSEEQDALKRELESCLVSAQLKEDGDLQELLLMVYGKDWLDSDDDYVYE